MAARRIRTESMIDRLGRKPMSEGFELWDKDYLLGALRLFQCKMEVAPPFEMGACMDAVAEILSELEDTEEAREHFIAASDKYSLVNKTMLSDLMACKAEEVRAGAQDALNRLVHVLEPFDARMFQGRKGDELMGDEGRGQEAAVGRCYLYRAELLGGLKRAEEGLEYVDLAISLGCERMHVAYARKGDLLSAIDRPDEAMENYEKATQLNHRYIGAFESWVACLRTEGREAESIERIDHCLKLHPKATLIRDKAFILSATGRDDEGLKILEKALQDPPAEETEEQSNAAYSVAILHKARAAILADATRYEEANRALESALAANPEDEEAESMRREVYLTIGREYLSNRQIPQYLNTLVAKILETKPEDPVAQMAVLVEEDVAQAQ